MQVESVFPLAEALRDAIAAVPGIVSCKIGREPNISPKDYPMARVIIDGILPGDLSRRSLGVRVFFGLKDAQAVNGVESTISSLMELEAAILQAAQQANDCAFVYSRTITDEILEANYRVSGFREGVIVGSIG